MELALQNITSPMHFVYVLAGIFNLGLEQERLLLAAQSQLDALRIMHNFLTHEVQVLELRQQIASQAATEMSKEQREYLLRQQRLEEVLSAAIPDLARRDKAPEKHVA